MSIEAYKAAWEADCTGSVKLTLLAIADYASKKNGYSCMASIKTLANMAGVSTRQIKRNVSTLEKTGLIIVDYRQGRSNTNIYSIYGLVKGDTHDTFTEEIKGDTHDQKVTPMTPFIEEKVTPMTVKGDTHDTLSITIHNNNITDDDPIQELSNHFTSVAGVFPSKSSFEVKWKIPLQMYLDNAGSLDKTKLNIEQAMDIARNGDKQYHITSPRSIASFIANLPKEGGNKVKVSAI